MKIYKAIILSSLLLIAPHTASALSMEKAVALALANNHSIKRAAFEHDSARAGLWEARAGFMPSLSASYSYATSSQDAYGSESDYSVATVTAAYNVFAGFSDYNRAGEAKARASAARYRARSTRAEVVLLAKKSYTEVLRTESSLITAGEGVALLERQRSDAALFYQEGLIARNELLKVEVELAKARQDLLEAEGGHRIARRALEKAIGTELSGEQLEPLSPPPDWMEMDFESMREELVSNRSELRYLRLTQEAYDHAASAFGGAMLPRVDLSISHSEYGDSPTIGGRDYSHDRETVSMVTASWTIFDGLRSYHGKSRQRYLARAAGESLKETEKELLLQLRSAIEDYTVARQKLVVGQTAVGQAQENYRVTDLQFRERVATTTDLLDARNYLTDAKDRYNTALYDLHVARATIERVLERNIPPE